jgi:hypothetical protein
MAAKLEPLEPTLIKPELQAVRDVVVSFLTAMKNSRIYVRDHAICLKSIENAKNRLDSYLKNYNRLRLEVEKTRLLYLDEPVHQDSPDGEKLASLFFRDGIQWVEFQQGLEVAELATFVRILNQYKTSPDESEGDLVTALWETDLPHLRYEAADFYWESEPTIDLSTLRSGEPGRCLTGKEDENAQTTSGFTVVQSNEHPRWKLKDEEISKFNQMVLEEEKHDFNEDLLDVVFILLTDRLGERDLVAVLEFLEDDFKTKLAQGEFRSAFKLLKGLHVFGRSHRIERPWVIPFLEDFLRTISKHSVLGVLSEVWQRFGTADSDRIKSLYHLLLLLPPEAAVTLAPMLPQIPSVALQRQLTEVIRIMAKRNLRPLEALLNRPEESLVQILIDIIASLEGDRPFRLLLKMIHHPSERVRKKTLKHLIARDPQALKKVFPLVEDPSETVRRVMLERLGQARSEVAEGLLLDYLAHKRGKLTNREHLLACYRALGRCGSSRSIPFLRGLLLDGGWIPRFGRSLDRRGAAVALVALKTKEAKKIIERASKSLAPSVRLAYRKAIGASR